MIDIAIEAAKAAGKRALELSASEIVYKKKNPLDILADADLEAEAIIKEIIKKNFPTHSILAEESGEDVGDVDFLWVVDPIDGTINFAKGLDEYCVSIALEHKGELVLGVIYQPVTGELYTAEKGKGAFLNGKKIGVSSEEDMIDCLLSLDNSSDANARAQMVKILEKIWGNFRQLRITGSSAISLAKVASGKLDVYFKTNFNYWDYAAGIVLVREAGGEVCDLLGNKVDRNAKSILATNGKLKDKGLGLIDYGSIK